MGQNGVNEFVVEPFITDAKFLCYKVMMARNINITNLPHILLHYIVKTCNPLFSIGLFLPQLNLCCNNLQPQDSLLKEECKNE